MLRIKSVLAMSLVLCFIVLTACGQAADKKAVGSSEQQQTETPAAETAPKEPVTIEFWYGLGGKLGENMKIIIEKFNASQEEVIVKGVAQGDYSETLKKLQAAIATSQVPAAVLSSNVDWARKGLFQSMDDYIAKDDGFKADDFVQTFLNQGKVDGKQYFLPLYGTTQVLYYSKAAFEKNGVKPEDLKTWEGLAAAAAKMTVKDGDKTKFYGWEPMWGSGNMMDAAYSNGGRVLSEDGKTVMIDSPEWVQAWDMFRKWIHDDKIMRIHSGGQGWEYWYKTIDDVMKGRAAGYTGSSGDQGDLDFNIVAALEQPGWEGKGEGRPEAGAILAGIPAKASDEQKQAAYKWFTFFTSAENTAFWSMNTGYIAVRQSALEDPAFKAYSDKNPQAKVPLMQASHATDPFKDPTGGKITDALKIAADKVQIENVPAAEALKEAKEAAQKELDKKLQGN